MKLQPYTWSLAVLCKCNFSLTGDLIEGPVAQSGRLPPSQGGGRGFKSRPVHQRRVNVT